MKHRNRRDWILLPALVSGGFACIAPLGLAHAQATREGAALVGGALPGGAILSARSVAVAPDSGGVITAAPVGADGTFRLVGLPAGPYRLAVTTTTVPKQTQGATFGEKVNAGLHAAGSAVAQGAASSRHDTAKNAIGNVRARETAPGAASAGTGDTQSAKLPDLGGMPNRISMNVTVGKQTQRVVLDESVIPVEVGADGSLAGRIAAP